MDALTLWVTLALLVVSVTLFYMTRRAHRAERIIARKNREIGWLLETLVIEGHKDHPRHLMDHEFRELTKWLA
jgi:hypothetical protein